MADQNFCVTRQDHMPETKYIIVIDLEYKAHPSPPTQSNVKTQTFYKATL